MKEITIVSKNQVGALADIAEALGKVGVNIEAISAHEDKDSAIFRLVTNDSETAKKTLSRLPSLRMVESDIIVLKLPNRPGELGKITRKLATKSIDLESVYIVTRTIDYTEVAIKPAKDDFFKAKEALGVK